jgi:simple sugar transport system substrate-binding protein
MPNYEIKEVDPAKRDISRRRFLRNAGMVAAGVPALGGLVDYFADPANAETIAKSATAGPFATHPNWKFAFINHVTTNPFFIATQYGAADACNLLGCSYTWTGSETSQVSQMVTAFDTAVAAAVSGIAIPLIDNHAFNTPVEKALGDGIPTLAYNADVTTGAAGNARQAYIGQNGFTAGVAAAQKILPFVKKGDFVGALLATPGSLNLQPRVDGAVSVLKPKGISVKTVATGALYNQETAAVDAWVQGAGKDAAFLYCCDDGTGQAAATAILKYKLTVKASGWDVAPTTLADVKSGQMEFTIDQQAYLQGFVPVVQLFLYQLSGGLMRPADTDTGLLFVVASSVSPYLATPTRFEGSSTAEKLVAAPKSIAF